MKRFFSLLVLTSLLASCDDGDLIVTDFNFEDQELEHCGDLESHVLFNINNEQVHEAIAFRFDLKITEPDFLSEEEGQISIPLNNSNQIIYRVFDGEVDQDYFCSDIPPVEPGVSKEFRSTTGGEVILTTTLANTTDHDSDGVTSQQESMETERDTDQDGIPDYLDIDDDADNVLTRVEIEVEATTSVNGFPDSDGDGTADYLDADDDNDQVITRYEDWNGNQNPADDQNDEGIPHYLNPEIVDDFPIDTFRTNEITKSYRYLLTVENLTLVNQGGDGEQIRLQDYVLGFYDSPALREVIEPGLDGEEPEENPEGDQ